MIDLARLGRHVREGETLQLKPGEYDSDKPIIIKKDMTIAGPREAIVHAEFQICGGANVRFDGFTLNMNKAGAPAHTGMFQPYPQNAMVAVYGGALFTSDDVEWTTGPFDKPALWVHAAYSAIRAISRFSRLDWRGSHANYAIEANYNSMLQMYGWPNRSGADGDPATLSLPCSPSVAAISVISSQATLSGCHVWKFGGDAACGIIALRFSKVQIGAGFYTTVQGFEYPTVVDATPSQYYVAPGCIG